MRLGQRVVDRVEHGAEAGQRRRADAQREDAHVLDAGIGQHPLVVGLADDEHRGHAPSRAGRSTTSSSRAEVAQAGRAPARACTRRMARKAQFSSAPGEQRRDHRRRLAVGVGQPGVQRRQAHLRAVADQQEAGTPPSATRGRAGRRAPAGRRPSGARRPRAGVRGHGQEEVAQQRQGDAHRADQQVLPRRLERRGGGGGSRSAARWPAWSPRRRPTAGRSAG